MSARQQQWANRAKAALIESLGGKCWACGSSESLEIDHPFGRDWRPSRKSFSWRISIYRREAAEKKIRLLCKTCNASSRFNRVLLPDPRQADTDDLAPDYQAPAEADRPF